MWSANPTEGVEGNSLYLLCLVGYRSRNVTAMEADKGSLSLKSLPTCSTLGKLLKLSNPGSLA